MEAKLNWYEIREQGGVDIHLTVPNTSEDNLEAYLDKVRGKLLKDKNKPNDETAIPGNGLPTEGHPSPGIPPIRTPYFDIGDGYGKVGQVVEVIVEAGCAYHMNGFHIGGGVGVQEVDGVEVPRSGYGKFKCHGATIGDYLYSYLKAQGLITVTPGVGAKPELVNERFFSNFQFRDWSQKALPEEFWEYAVGFFSVQDKRGPTEAIPIPAGTELFTLGIEILRGTPPGEYVLTCKDEYYYTQEHQRRRDYTYTYPPQGFTKIDTWPGKLTVIE